MQLVNNNFIHKFMMLRLSPKLLVASALFFQIIWMSSVESARILVIFPPAAPSHFFLGSTLVNGLLDKGHDITFISSFGIKEERKNLKNIVLTELKLFSQEHVDKVLKLNEKSIFSQFSEMMNLTNGMTVLTLQNSEVQNLLQSKDEHFDLIIMETFLSEAHVAFAHHFDCPLIVVSTVGSTVWVDYLVGNESPPSYVPQMLTALTGPMNFWDRVKNFITVNIMEILYSSYHLPGQKAIVQTYFPSAPSLYNIIQERVALVLLNSHPSFSPAKPSTPNMIEIGGFHIAEPKPLPKNLQDYLDEAKEGFILFSMGSNLKSTMLPTKMREEIMKVFAQLQYKILWKFEDEQMPGKPNNVRIDKWLPQNDILAHPNLKLFITHGGLLSTTEAVYHGVPVVGIPVFGDQKMNMAAAEKLGIGKTVDFSEISYEKLLTAVQEVLNNKKYKEAARKRSKLFRDQPIRPIDSAMYWIEYVLRHKYLKHLSTNAVHLTWYQIRSLDVLLFLGSITFSIIFVLLWGIKKCCCRSTTCKKSEQEKQKKQ